MFVCMRVSECSVICVLFSVLDNTLIHKPPIPLQTTYIDIWGVFPTYSALHVMCFDNMRVRPTSPTLQIMCFDNLRGTIHHIIYMFKIIKEFVISLVLVLVVIYIILYVYIIKIFNW